MSLLKSRHPHMKGIYRLTDGTKCYNSHAAALAMTEIGKITGVRVDEVSHNEPGHGGDLVDMYGACSISVLWLYVREYKTPLDDTKSVVVALNKRPLYINSI